MAGSDLTMASADGPVLAAASRAAADAGAIAATWCQLCRWDPSLPPDAVPSDPIPVVQAVAQALGRPQPLGWGVDPAVEAVMETFAQGASEVDVAVGQLVCLREALHRHLLADAPPAELPETVARIDMVLDRAILLSATVAARALRRQALTDALTGLPNRWAFERDLDIEVARARRHDRPLALVAIDLDGLKAINDTHGHAAGDLVLSALARALEHGLRGQDRAYRTGGDEFALLLPETDGDGALAVVERMRSEAPAFTAGVAVAAAGTEPAQLVAAADDELMQRKRTRPTTRR